MTTPRFAKLATDLLAEEGSTRAASSEVEMRAVAAIEAALARRRRSRRIAQIAGASAIAVAATLIVVFAGWSRTKEKETAMAPAPSAAPPVVAAKAVEAGEGTLIARDGRKESLVRSMTLAAGDRIETSPKDGSEIGLADGSRVRVGSGSEISLNELSTTRRILLTRGTLRADVAKLGPTQRFIVDTEDAEVEVHGTSFVVTVGDPASGCTARTRVEVTEGVVSVRSGDHEDRVPAGSTWPVCEVHAPRDAGTRVPVTAPPSSAATTAAPPSIPPVPASASASASHALAAQNALFAKANAARRAGDGPAAVAAYDRLLAEYPDGFLAESAAVERMRVLDGMDRARGREAASAYLARYPNGFARAEALRMAH